MNKEKRMGRWGNASARAKTAGAPRRLPEGRYLLRPTSVKEGVSRKGQEKIELEMTVLAKGQEYNGAKVRLHFSLGNDISMDKLFAMLYRMGADMKALDADEDGSVLMGIMEDLVMEGPQIPFMAKHQKDNPDGTPSSYNNWNLIDAECPVVWDTAEEAPADKPEEFPQEKPAAAPAKRKSPFA